MNAGRKYSYFNSCFSISTVLLTCLCFSIQCIIIGKNVMVKFGIYNWSSGQILPLSKLSNVGEANRGAVAWHWFSCNQSRLPAFQSKIHCGATPILGMAFLQNSLSCKLYVLSWYLPRQYVHSHFVWAQLLKASNSIWHVPLCEVIGNSKRHWSCCRSAGHISSLHSCTARRRQTVEDIDYRTNQHR